jgi:hypothetical protein
MTNARREGDRCLVRLVVVDKQTEVVGGVRRYVWVVGVDRALEGGRRQIHLPLLGE